MGISRVVQQSNGIVEVYDQMGRKIVQKFLISTNERVVTYSDRMIVSFNPANNSVTTYDEKLKRIAQCFLQPDERVISCTGETFVTEKKPFINIYDKNAKRISSKIG